MLLNTEHGVHKGPCNDILGDNTMAPETWTPKGPDTGELVSWYKRIKRVAQRSYKFIYKNKALPRHWNSCWQ